VAPRGPCGELVGRVSEVEAKPVPQEMAEGGVRIRWLIGPEGDYNFYMRVFEMPPGSHIKGHSHPWEHEILVLEGGGRVRIGSTTYDVGEGNFMYIPPNVEHEYWAGERGMRFLCIIPSKPTAPEEKVEC